MTSRDPLLKWSEETWARWSAMPRLSLTTVPRTKFLLLKTPVSTVYEEKFGDRNVFTVPMYVQRLIAKGIAVGLVIDCTALDLDLFDCDHDNSSSNFYFHNTDEWSDFGIDYYKLGAKHSETTTTTTTTERGETDRISSDIIKDFLRVCSEFWVENPTLHVALFDGRGGNGAAAFFAAYYLCHRWKAPVHTALTLVERASPNSTTNDQKRGLLDIHLIEKLQKTFHGQKEITVDYSNYPQWWFGNGNEKPSSDNCISVVPPFVGDAVQSKDAAFLPSKTKASTSSTTDKKDDPCKRLKLDGNEAESRFLELLSPESQKFIRAVTVLRELTLSHASDNSIRCRSEMALNEEILVKLQHGKYLISWKPVGRRGFLLVLTEGTYFIENVDNGIHFRVSLLKCPLYFPNPQKPSALQHRTLLDVTLIMDGKVPRFLISDILVHMGGTLLQKTFRQRLKYLMDGVIAARKKSVNIWNYEREMIKLRAKEYFELDKTEFVLKHVMPAQMHEVSGLEIILAEGPYTFDVDEGSCSVFFLQLGDEILSKKMVDHIQMLLRAHRNT